MLSLFGSKEPQPLPVEPAVALDPTNDEYNSLAQKLGMGTPPAVGLDFRKFLAENGIPHYDLLSVERYLVKLAREASRRIDYRMFHYVWVPARQADLDHAKLEIPGEKQVSSLFGAAFNGQVTMQVYSKPIPYPVLVTMDRIVEAFGDKVSFYVSDFEFQELDPFLMVIAPDGSRWIVERWDEPSFRGAAK